MGDGLLDTWLCTDVYVDVPYHKIMCVLPTCVGMYGQFYLPHMHTNSLRYPYYVDDVENSISTRLKHCCQCV